MYGPIVSQPLLGLGPQPNSVIAKPKPHAALSPFGQVISISSHPPSHLGPYSVNHSLRSELIAWPYNFSIVR